MFYKKMKDLREQNDLTQQEIANILNVSRSTYAGWENGIDYIPLTRLNDFCNYFEISFDYICELSNNKEKVVKKRHLNKIRIGKLLRSIRVKNKDTQKYISYIIKTDQSNYSNYETGKILIPTHLLVQFAKHYNVSIDYLLERTKNKEIIK